MTNKNKVGLVFAAVLGGLHVVWSLLVLSGFAQKIYDFVLWAHMINLPLTVGPFDLTAAIVLVLMTTAIGYVMGYFTGWIWARVHRS